jgi:hypothetical protein
MPDIQKLAAACAVVISAFGVVGWPSGALAASASRPNDAYCQTDTENGSRWCGYATMAQCEASASGTGGDCTENVFRKSDLATQNAYDAYRPKTIRK